MTAHILLLDDDAGILILARRTLERVGYRVSAYQAAADAYRHIATEVPDLLILDYQLNTAESGLDFFRNLLAQGVSCPAILVTGFADEARMIEALRAGVADVVPKAGDYLDYLPEAVERVLAQVHLKQQLADAELLRDRELHYRTLAEALPHLVWTCTPEGTCDFLSKQWCDYTGMSDGVQLGDRRLIRALHPEDRKRTRLAWRAAVEGRADYEIEFRLRDHSGVYRWFQTRGVPVRDRDQRIVKWFGTCTDIHDQRQAAEERECLLLAEQAARQAAEEANRTKDRFLAMLSHELRTPLTPVLASARMLERIADLPDNVQRDVRLIRRNIELEARLIDDLLDLTRVANGKLRLSLETVDVHELIDAVLNISASDIHAKHLQVERDYAARRHHVCADRARLHQMLWNLVKNAAKFTPVSGRIVLRTRDLEDERIAISVEDSGIGIEPDRIDALFNAFEQGDQRTTRQFGGLGLGLAITKALTEIHGGTVVANSPGRDQGAIFTITLAAVDAACALPDKAPRDSTKAGNTLRILLIEDHADTADVMARLMESFGHAVHTVSTLADALAIVNDTQFGLVVSDIGLPDGTGLDFIRAFRRRSQAPAIALTGFGMEDDVRRCLNAGFTSHLTKPVNLVRLEHLIEQVAAVSGQTAPVIDGLNAG